MTSNEKTQNYKVVNLVESYNFHIEIIFVQIFMNKYDSSKVRSCHADKGWHDKTILLCRLEWRDKFDMWNIYWQTPFERSRACQRSTLCQANAYSTTACLISAIKRVKSKLKNRLKINKKIRRGRSGGLPRADTRTGTGF